ncbi:LCP family protein [Paenibacillus sp. 1001270B_150601_E10]|uniref:LCP family glycopolymer transferase n=1 Tax=Paenibacillus sp. 1001270B_150601_E10 TaxID=2787079 RepID=UPI00189CF4F5|nr:LCP family protein [Paenibacillus sp. 1001270B_150601_E10]
MRKFWSKRKKWEKTVVVSLLLFTGIVVGCVGFFVYKLQHTAEAIYEPLPPSDYRVKVGTIKPLSTTGDTDTTALANTLTTPNLRSGDPFTLLLIGVDERGRDSGRSDTLILAVINPSTPAATLISIPRDTMTSIAGKNKEDKINHAYAFGGVPMAVATVEQMLQIPIDHYIKTNMQGFEEIIDALGGVDINNKRSFSLDDQYFEEGPLHLSGEKALAYVRMRKADPKGDFGRMDRQQEVLSSLSKKALTFEGALQWVEVIDKLSMYVKTSIPSSEWTKIMQNYNKALSHIERESLNGTGFRKDGIYYWQLEQGEKERVHELIVEKLGVKPN